MPSIDRLIEEIDEWDDDWPLDRYPRPATRMPFQRPATRLPFPKENKEQANSSPPPAARAAGAR